MPLPTRPQRYCDPASPVFFSFVLQSDKQTLAEVPDVVLRTSMPLMQPDLVSFSPSVFQLVHLFTIQSLISDSYFVFHFPSFPPAVRQKW